MSLSEQIAERRATLAKYCEWRDDLDETDPARADVAMACELIKFHIEQLEA